MNNNEAYVVSIVSVDPIEGADRIEKAVFSLNGIIQGQVVVGKSDFKVGDLAVYFDSNLCITDRLIKDIDAMNPQAGTEAFSSLATYLAKGNRIRCIKLKGTISNGLLLPVIKFLHYFDSEILAGSALKEGASFTKLEGIELCSKWYPPVNNPVVKKSGKLEKRKRKFSRIIPELFHFHIDTEQLIKNVGKIKFDSVLSISRKIHGTSGICANAKVYKKLPLSLKILKKLKVPIVDTEYTYLYSSRKVIRNEAEDTGFYKVDVWTQVGKEIFEGRLHKGETAYFEITGYLPKTSSFIQKNYDYGCKVGEYKVNVYRITFTNDDGIVFEYSWEEMKQRCKEIGVKPVEEFFFGKLTTLYPDLKEEDENWRAKFIENLQRDYLEKMCKDNLSKKVPEEGIVLRIENKDIEAYKLKSMAFFLYESKEKEEEGYVDLEETT